MTRLIHSPLAVGRTSRELAENPGAIREVHDDVLRDLMTTPHPIQKRAAAMGHTGSDSETSVHARRRTCV